MRRVPMNPEPPVTSTVFIQSSAGVQIMPQMIVRTRPVNRRTAGGVLLSEPRARNFRRSRGFVSQPKPFSNVFLSAMIQDLKYAFRNLLRTKGWTTVVVLSLMLGIGANTALFSAVNGLLIQTLPVPDPQTLVRLKWSGKNDMVRNDSEYGFSAPHEGQDVRSTFSVPMFEALRAANQTLTDLFAAAP